MTPARTSTAARPDVPRRPRLPARAPRRRRTRSRRTPRRPHQAIDAHIAAARYRRSRYRRDRPVRRPGRHRRRLRRGTRHRIRPAHHRPVHRHRTPGRHLVVAPAPARSVAHRPDRAARRHPGYPAGALGLATAAGTATTGRLMRWLPGNRTTARSVAATYRHRHVGRHRRRLLIVSVLMSSDSHAKPLAVIAVAASLTRIAWCVS